AAPRVPDAKLTQAVKHLANARTHLRFARSLEPDDSLHSDRKSMLDVFKEEVADLVWRLDQERARFKAIAEPPDEEEDREKKSKEDLHAELVDAVTELSEASLRVADALTVVRRHL